MSSRPKYLTSTVLMVSMLTPSFGIAQGRGAVAPVSVSVSAAHNASPYVTDLSGLAAAGRLVEVQGLEAEIARIESVLSGGAKGNGVLVGDHATAISPIGEALAVKWAASPKRNGRRVVKLDVAGILSASPDFAAAASSKC